MDEAKAQMSKPFDMEDLIARCKEHGLEVGEELAKVLADQTLDWVKESCEIHQNVFLRMFAPMVNAIRGSVMAELDKIDGQVG